MPSETLHIIPENERINNLIAKQNSIIQEIHTLEKNSTGATYFGPLRVYREPQSFSLRLKQDDSYLTFDQDRFETNDLGVKSRTSLTCESIGESGQLTTDTYRCSGIEAKKRHLNGGSPVIEKMTITDFEKAGQLLDLIIQTVKASKASRR